MVVVAAATAVAAAAVAATAVPADHLDDEEEEEEDVVVARLETPAAFTAVETAYRGMRYTWRTSQHKHMSLQRVTHQRKDTGRNANFLRVIIIHEGNSTQ